MRQETSRPQAVTQAAPIPSADWACLSYREKTAQVMGTFSGSVVLEGTLDGSTWAPVADDVSVPCIVEISASVAALRANGAGITSGAATVYFSGFNARTE